MPGFDQTGPRGEGPMTGGGFGRCNPNNANMNAGYGVGRGGRPRGGGRGRCFGGGRGYGAYPPSFNAAPAADLQNDVRNLTEEVARLRAELDRYRQKDASDEAERAE